jgi:hypothetical protein
VLYCVEGAQRRVMGMPSFCTIFFSVLVGLGRRGVNCMCSGSARVWEQLCSPGESNLGLKVPRDGREKAQFS